MIEEHRDKMNQHTSGEGPAIYTGWDQEIEPEVTQEDDHDGIL
jgi:hypothetical protein